jgi:hypothetical protein
MRVRHGLFALAAALLLVGATTPALARPPRNNFTLSAAPAKVTVKAGRQAHFTISVPRGPGFYAPIGLTVSRLPRGTSAGFTPFGAGYDLHRTMLVATRTSAKSGSYRLTITARGGSRVHHRYVTLVIRH